MIHFKKISLAIVFFLCSISASSQKIIGYATSWSGDADDIPYSCLTHINYAFALPSADGHLRTLENIPKLISIVQQAHAAGIKVLISVGGWSDENGPLDAVFEVIGNNASYRSNLISDILDLVDTYDLDGADIDWEYPDAGSSARNYDSLMTGLYRQLHPAGKLLTTAVAGNSWGGAGIDIYIKNVVDWINIMGYDYNSYEHSTYTESIAGVEYYRNKGFMDSLMALGVPFYGRDSWESFAELVNKGADPYSDTFNGVGYNGINTIQQKADYVKASGLAGIMIWELSQDLKNQYSLVTCICNAFIATGIADQETGSVIRIFPNPFRGLFRITSSENITEVNVYDNQGRLIQKGKCNSRDISMDLSRYSSGIYFLHLKLGSKETRLKVSALPF